VTLPASTTSGSSFELDCNSINAGYEGDFNVTCTEGTFSGDVSPCTPRRCEEQQILALFAGLSMSVSVPGTYFTEAAPLDSDWSGQADCSLLHPEVSGSFSAVCLFGVSTLNTAACMRSCMPGDQYSVTIGSTTQSLTLDARINSSGSDSIPCNRIGTDWLGSISLGCSQGTISADSQACLAPCAVDQQLTVSLGSSVTIALPTTLLSGESILAANCSSFGSIYSGQVNVTCSQGLATGDVTTCVADSSAVTNTIQMIQQAISLSIPVADGTDLDELNEAMNTPEARTAMQSTISGTLGLQPDDIEILAITVIQTRRLEATGRRLNTASASVAVNYQVRADAGTAAGVDADALTSRMTSLADTSSAENQQFTSSFSDNLRAATTTMDSGSSADLLTSVANEVDARGIVIASAAPPTTITVQVPPSVSGNVLPQDEEDEDETLVLTVVAGVLGVGTAFLCAIYAHRKLGKKLEQVQPISDISQDPRRHGQQEADDQVADIPPPAAQGNAPVSPIHVPDGPDLGLGQAASSSASSSGGSAVPAGSSSPAAARYNAAGAPTHLT
jgi:hypothetical protein